MAGQPPLQPPPQQQEDKPGLWERIKKSQVGKSTGWILAGAGVSLAGLGVYNLSKMFFKETPESKASDSLADHAKVDPSHPDAEKFLKDNPEYANRVHGQAASPEQGATAVPPAEDALKDMPEDVRAAVEQMEGDVNMQNSVASAQDVSEVTGPGTFESAALDHSCEMVRP